MQQSHKQTLPYRVTEASQSATESPHSIPNVSLMCFYTTGTGLGSHQTFTEPGLVPGLTHFCPDPGGKAPAGHLPKCLSNLSIRTPKLKG